MARRGRSRRPRAGCARWRVRPRARRRARQSPRRRRDRDESSIEPGGCSRPSSPGCLAARQIPARRPIRQRPHAVGGNVHCRDDQEQHWRPRVTSRRPERTTEDRRRRHTLRQLHARRLHTSYPTSFIPLALPAGTGRSIEATTASVPMSAASVSWARRLVFNRPRCR